MDDYTEYAISNITRDMDVDLILIFRMEQKHSKLPVTSDFLKLQYNHMVSL